MGKIRTHYDNLKVARDAPDVVIRAAYRALVQKHHPDKNPGDMDATRALQIINQSYEVLSNPSRRDLHDKWIAQEELSHSNAAARSGSHSSSTPPPPPPPSPPTPPPPPPPPPPPRADTPSEDPDFRRDGGARQQGADSRGFWSKLINGHFGLATTYWVFGLAPWLAVNLAFVVIEPLAAIRTAASWILLAILAYLAYWITFAIGCWRAATRYQGPTIWSSLTKVVLCLGWLNTTVIGLSALTLLSLLVQGGPPNAASDTPRHQPVHDAPQGSPPATAQSQEPDEPDSWELLIPSDHPAYDVVHDGANWVTNYSNTEVELSIHNETLRRRDGQITFWERKRHLIAYIRSSGIEYPDKFTNWTLYCHERTYSWGVIIEKNRFGRVLYAQDFGDKFKEPLEPGSKLEAYHSEFCRDQ